MSSARMILQNILSHEIDYGFTSIQVTDKSQSVLILLHYWDVRPSTYYAKPFDYRFPFSIFNYEIWCVEISFYFMFLFWQSHIFDLWIFCTFFILVYDTYIIDKVSMPFYLLYYTVIWRDNGIFNMSIINRICLSGRLAIEWLSYQKIFVFI